MGRFSEESEIIINAGRTPTRGNWVSVEWNRFEVMLSDSDKVAISQIELREMCIKCLNVLFG
jgi:hypothetical protein